MSASSNIVKMCRNFLQSPKIKSAKFQPRPSSSPNDPQQTMLRTVFHIDPTLPPLPQHRAFQTYQSPSRFPDILNSPPVALLHMLECFRFTPSDLFIIRRPPSSQLMPLNSSLRLTGAISQIVFSYQEQVFSVSYKTTAWLRALVQEWIYADPADTTISHPSKPSSSFKNPKPKYLAIPNPTQITTVIDKTEYIFNSLVGGGP
ncbi:hypothetical protein C8J56DRAFT_901083 [Mycena floridula]|nr:hypothetical protein C8J56DRAFT_901083 [Mycena floridula]